MKSSTIHTLAVAVAMALSATSSMAGTVEPVSQSEKHTTSATAAISAAPFYALNRLDAQSLAEQEMTDQELKAVEGGEVRDSYDRYANTAPWVYTTDIYSAFTGGFMRTCGC